MKRDEFDFRSTPCGVRVCKCTDSKPGRPISNCHNIETPVQRKGKDGRKIIVMCLKVVNDNNGHM